MLLALAIALNQAELVLRKWRGLWEGLSGWARTPVLRPGSHKRSTSARSASEQPSPANEQVRSPRH